MSRPRFPSGRLVFPYEPAPALWTFLSLTLVLLGAAGLLLAAVGAQPS